MIYIVHLSWVQQYSKWSTAEETRKLLVWMPTQHGQKRVEAEKHRRWCWPWGCRFQFCIHKWRNPKNPAHKTTPQSHSGPPPQIYWTCLPFWEHLSHEKSPFCKTKKNPLQRPMAQVLRPAGDIHPPTEGPYSISYGFCWDGSITNLLTSMMSTKHRTEDTPWTMCTGVRSLTAQGSQQSETYTLS